MSYYNDRDLAKFSKMGKFKPDLWKKFLDYYNAATGDDGALTKREKALIALAISHFKQCPYCIDAYTTASLEAGSNPDEMTEAIHVASAMAAGMCLVHGVQMHNHLEKSGAV